MSKTVPWGVHYLSSMISHCDSTEVDGKWVRAVPLPYFGNPRERLRAAWWVFTGRAQAVVWPKPGELEDALSGRLHSTGRAAE